MSLICKKCGREQGPALAFHRETGQHTSVGYLPCVCSYEYFLMNRSEFGESFEEFQEQMDARYPRPKKVQSVA